MRIDAGDPDPRWCAIPAGEMRAWQAFLGQAGAISRDLDVTRAYTTALVERANDFDPAAVQATGALAARAR
jgi:hypothetical protein